MSSLKLTTLPADVDTYNRYKMKPLGQNINSYNGSYIVNPGEGIYDDDKTLGKKHTMTLHGGGGRGLKIEFEVWWEVNNPNNEFPKGYWESYYGMSLDKINGFIINARIIDDGVGFPDNCTLEAGKSGLHKTPITIHLVGEDTGISDSTIFSGAGKSFWENDYINPHKAPFILRELDGMRQLGVDMSGHKFESVHGWQNLFGAHSYSNNFPKNSYHATDTSCLLFKTQNSIQASQGLIFGNVLAHQSTETQRWMIPRGLQFCWSNFGSANNSYGLQLQAIFLLWKFKGEKVTRYNVLIDGSKFVNDKGSRILMHDHLNQYQPGNDRYGVIRTYMKDEDFEFLHEKRAACIGCYMRYGNHKQGTFYDNFVSIFNFRFLFSYDTYTRSRILIPPATDMDDYQEKGVRVV